MNDYWVRTILAIIFPSFLVLTIFALFTLFLMDYVSWKETKEAIEIVAPVLTGYVGSIIGYYFSKRK